MDKKSQHRSKSNSAQRNPSGKINYIIKWNRKKPD